MVGSVSLADVVALFVAHGAAGCATVLGLMEGASANGALEEHVLVPLLDDLASASCDCAGLLLAGRRFVGDERATSVVASLGASSSCAVIDLLR